VGTVRTVLYYPLSTGRNFDEIMRIVIALQKADADSVATPADWQPGDDVIVAAARFLWHRQGAHGKPDRRSVLPGLVHVFPQGILTSQRLDRPLCAP